MDEYIQRVTSRAGPTAEPLDLVDAAAAVARELADAGDAVLDRFVLEAHRAGHSWTQIGERLGMTRQAARQRFGTARVRPLDDDGVEVLPRLAECLDAARAEAAADGVGPVDTDYLLLGLLHVGVAANALDRLGVTRARVRDAIGATAAPVTGADESELSAEAERALANTRATAAERGQGYVGTEHLLFCLATDPGSRAHRVLQHLGVDTAAVKRELDDLVPARPKLIRRRRRGRACSFCDRSASTGTRLVAGTGACICADCARQAVAVSAS